MSAPDPVEIGTVVRRCYTSGDPDGARRAAERLARIDNDGLLAPRTRAACGSLADPPAWRDAWHDLHERARAAGDPAVAHTARFFVDALGLPLPPFRAELDADSYARLLAAELDRNGLDVETRPAGLWLDGANLTPRLCVTDGFGVRRALFVLDHPFNAISELNLQATLRALRHSPAWQVTLPLWLAPGPLPYHVCRWIAGGVAALVDLEAEADPSLRALDENVAPLIFVAQRAFGRELTLDRLSIRDLDAIVARYDEDGFGDVTFGFACQLASYLWQMIAHNLPGCTARNATDARLPRLLVLPDGEVLDLVDEVRSRFRAAAPEPLSSLFARCIGETAPIVAEGHT